MADKDLTDFIQEVTGESHLRVEEDLGGGFVRLRITEAERRQAQQDIRCSEDVVLELLRNARDAGAHVIYVAIAREGKHRIITVIDDGAGIPKPLWETVFEPRVTSKLDTFHSDQWGVHGRGMALFSIACNSVEHGVVASGSGSGTSIRVRTDTDLLPEKTDQSSMPRFVREKDGRRVIRGTRNINRIISEFTLNQKGACLVFAGSPSEVLATMVENGTRALSLVERAFARDIGEYPVCLRPALAATPDELADIAGGVGLAISSRNARRVLDGEVRPLPPFMSLLNAVIESPHKGHGESPRRTSARAPRIAPEDLDRFGRRVQDAYDELARAYYLDGSTPAKVEVARGTLTVCFPLVAREE